MNRRLVLDRHQTTLGLIGYFCIGVAAVLIPSAMPSITAEFERMGLPLAVLGLIFPATAAGGILGNLLAGVAADVLGRRWLVGLSALILALALALAALIQNWLFFVLGFVVVGAAQGSLATGVNAMIADANPASRARALNALHGVYGVGAAVSPLVFGFLIDRGLPWRWSLAGTSLLWLLYGLAAYLAQRNAAPAEQTNTARKLDLSLLSKRPFAALFLISFIYNGIAVGLLGWIAVFMQQSAGFSALFSISTISIFYVGLTVGRFICAAIAERFRYSRILLVLSIGIALTYPLLVLDVPPVVVVISVLLTGLSLSGLFPTALAYGAKRYPEQSVKLSGTLNVGLTLGSMLPPLWIGLIAERWSFQAALGLNYALVLPLVLMCVYLGRVERGEAHGEAHDEARDETRGETRPVAQHEP